MGSHENGGGDEARTLQRQLRQKDAALVKLTEELERTRERADAADADARSRAAEVKRLELEARRAQQSSRGGDARRGPSPAPNTMDILRDLENESKSKDRVIKELQAEVKVMQRQLKDREREIVKKTKLAEARNGEMDDVASLQAEVRELRKRLEAAQEEARTITRVEQAKTAVIEKLTTELDSRGASEDIVQRLHDEIRRKERELADVVDDRTTLHRMLQQKESALRELAEKDASRDVRAQWFEERRQLQAQIEKQVELRHQVEKQMAAGEKRARALQQRIDFLAQTLANPDVNARQALAAAQVRTPQKAVAAPSGATAEDGTVPAELYHRLEVAVQSLTLRMRERETQILEKDDAIWSLQRRVDILQHANTSMEKRLALEVGEQRAVVESLKDELASRDDSLRTLERKVEITKHSRSSASKSAKRNESELLVQIGELRAALQRKDAELAQRDSVVRVQLEDTQHKLTEENARLRSQLKEMVDLHADLRVSSMDSARQARLSVVVIDDGQGHARAAADGVVEGSKSVSGVEVTLYSANSAKDMCGLPAVDAAVFAESDAVVVVCAALNGQASAETNEFLVGVEELRESPAGRVAAVVVAANSRRREAEDAILRRLLGQGICVVGTALDEARGVAENARGSGAYVAQLVRRLVRGK